MGGDRAHLPVLPPGHPGRLGGDEPGHHPENPRPSDAGRRWPPDPQRPEPKRRQLYLRVVEPPAREGQTFDLDDELTIGRSPGCGVPTPDDIYASTLHARLFRQKDQLWVEDLGSTNGTYVNSEKITQAQRLGRGDVLQAGSTVFEVTR